MLLYPWHQVHWRTLQQRIAAQRLPHALLFSGQAGLGKLDFARLLAHSLLCEQVDAKGLYCGQCNSCRLFAAQTHPDFQPVQPESEGKDIVIAQIRELLDWQAKTPQYGRAKVVIIEPADRMNINAANALLKTLEEPADRALLILISDRPSSLLPTIRSRCQQLPFIAQPQAEVLPWLVGELGDENQARLLLSISAGAPLRALKLSKTDYLQRRAAFLDDFAALLNGDKEPISLAAEWLKHALPELLTLLHSWYIDMARLAVQGSAAQLEHPDLRKYLQALSERVDLAEILRRQQQLQEALQRLFGHPNPSLLLEELLLGWSNPPKKLPR